MKSMGRRQALLALGVTLGACTPEQKVVTQSNATAVSGQKLSRVLIGVRLRTTRLTPAQYESLLQPSELRQAFEAKWTPLGITVEVVDGDKFPGDSPMAFITDINTRFQASQVLLLHTSHARWRGAYVQDYDIDADLYDSTAGKRIWRGSTSLPDFWRVVGTPSKRPEAADRYVDGLTATLRKDGLI
jgi:hypothetical protein